MNKTNRSRSGFTLLELLMVISIISLLVALILPAVMSVTSRAKEADTYSEIMGLSNALDSFKARYGVYPPSSITLYEKASDWNTPAAAPHKAMLRRIFGTEFDFQNRDPVTGNPRNRNINGNGIDTEVITLTGQECLVFFLGGIPAKNGSSIVMTGFSTSRRNPFEPVSPSGSGTRIKFFTAFDSTRLVDTDGNGMPEYLAKYQSVPLLYFSTTNPSNSYQASDCPGTLTSVYLLGPTGPAYKADAFQIISGGWDGVYGTGGEYRQEDANALLVGAREAERDNITNFSGSKLAD